MPSTQIDGVRVALNRTEGMTEHQYEKWNHWPVNWSAIWVGTLSAVAAVLIFGLVGLALGAHLLGPEHRVVDLKKIALGTLAFSVFSAFLSFVIGGWTAGKVAGILRSEPGMLQGAIVWLTAMPVLVLLAGVGAGNYLGGWYAGLAGTPSWATPAALFERPESLDVSATAEERREWKEEQAAYKQKVKQWQEDSPKVTRNSALGVVTALLLGLIGSVIGGWMASGEPMTLTYHRTRQVTR
jgi:hypothetical protein